MPLIIKLLIKTNSMKNLILTGAMLLLLGATSAVAQETPKKQPKPVPELPMTR